jgi:glycosyltransferase involved in cell wall biosynthesis
MDVTVAIPTHNRADELRLTLAGLRQVCADGVGQFEIVVVGNNCTDPTPSVVDQFQGAFGRRLRYVEEARPGLNYARNRALSEARFPVVAFLDDDVDVDRNWLGALARAHADGRYAAVGGKAYLVYPGDGRPPRWLGPAQEGLLSKVDHGDVRREVGPGDLFGLNLSVRKEWTLRVGLFRPDLDRVGTCLISGGETDFLERIARAGGKLLYEPDAVVGHRVSSERLRRGWFLSRRYWGARSCARMLSGQEVSTYLMTRYAWHLRRALWTSTAALVRHGPGSETFFRNTCDVAERWGMSVGLGARLVRQAMRRSAGDGAVGPAAQVESA